MRIRTILTLLLFLSAVFFISGFSPLPEECSDIEKISEVNVITMSDTGGGGMTFGQVVLASFLGFLVMAFMLFIIGRIVHD
jgi:hypothetical protein